MKSSSTYKILFLLNLLTQKACTKKQIMEAFEKNNLKITKSLITNYIDKITKNGIVVSIEKYGKNEKLYFIKNTDATLTLNKKELSAISDIKKLLIIQKDYNKIRKTMRLFYKLACLIENEETKLEFINFGYYSTINWRLVEKLEKHCNQKDIITIDYIMPNGTNRFITIHANDIKTSEWSERLYLHGVLKNSKQFSSLPIDRIFMIKKVEQKNAPLDIQTDMLTYVVSIEKYKQTNVDEKEKIIKIKNHQAFIQRPIDDNFYILQRLFYFCPNLYYVSNSTIKNLLKEKLEKLKNIYDN